MKKSIKWNLLYYFLLHSPLSLPLALIVMKWASFSVNIYHHPFSFFLSALHSLSLSIFPKITKWLAQLKVYEEKSMVIKLQIFSAPPTHHCWQNTTEESAHSKGDHLHGKIGSSILSLFLLFSWLGLAHRLFCQPFFLLSGQKNMNRSVAGHRSSYHFPPYLFISYIIIFLARSK